MVFRYLLLHRHRPVHREVLMELLWPGSSPQSARNNLNVAIYGLRRSLEDAGDGPFIIYNHGSYGFDPSLQILVDIDDFVATARNAQSSAARDDVARARVLLERVLETYQGPVFADDADGEWYSLTRREMADLYLEMLELDAELHLRSGDATRCVEACHELLRRDPCRETTHCLLMRAYVFEHRYHLAARQYADCVSALADELGVGPHPSTTALFSELLAHQR
jgi:DNA-binding SARP family transcriptional activator